MGRETSIFKVLLREKKKKILPTTVLYVMITERALYYP